MILPATPINTTEFCAYGCGELARYINKSQKLICSEYPAQCRINKEKNSANTKKQYKLGRKTTADWYQSAPQSTKDKMMWNKGKYNPEFSTNTKKTSHKNALILERGYRCECCKLDIWLNEPIPLELEHIDGNNRNNTKDNLLLLCPNCHAKTKYYRGRNINTGKIKVTDDQILAEINKGLNNRNVLINVGLTPKGGNYARVNDLRYAYVVEQNTRES